MSRGTMDGAVYVQTNEEENQVVAFARAADGTLRELGRYATGGAGDGRPHLTSQGSVVLSDDGSHLLVTNVASDEVGVFRVDGTGESILFAARHLAHSLRTISCGICGISGVESPFNELAATGPGR
jgi:6-phosphogluconolactonase (cycloisomerase 2 family)